LILLEQETVSGSGISWATGKSAPRNRQITTPAPNYSSFFTGWMPFLPPNQQCQSIESIINSKKVIQKRHIHHSTLVKEEKNFGGFQLA